MIGILILGRKGSNNLLNQGSLAWGTQLSREWHFQFACVKTNAFDPVLFLRRGERWAPNPRRSPAQSRVSLATTGGTPDRLH